MNKYNCSKITTTRLTRSKIRTIDIFFHLALELLKRLEYLLKC